MEIRKKISLFMENEKIEVSQIAQKVAKLSLLFPIILMEKEKFHYHF